ncbi:MAG: MMPL family transporter [Deltaproteobacteria bacterium]|nr:MMPL family transporter [Deltaproteobacteria bacterium]
MVNGFISKRLAAFLARNMRRNAIAVLLTALCLFPSITYIRFENSVESFLPSDNQDGRYYDKFKEQFGDDQIIALVIPMGDSFTKDALEKIEALSESIEKLPDVRKVRSITTAQNIVGTDDSFEVLPFLDKIPEDAAALAKVREEALSNPLYKIDLISTSGDIASILIEAKLSKDDERYRRIVDGLEQIMASSPFGNRYYLAGDPIIELQMTNDMWGDLAVFVPLTYLVLILLLYYCYRDLQGVVVPLATVSISTMLLMETIGLSGITMNAVTVGLPSLTLCIAVLHAIHLISAYRKFRAQGMEPDNAVQQAILNTLAPCFYSALTMGVGFISVCVTDLVPVQQFGMLAAYSVVLSYVASFMFAPWLMRLIPASGGEGRLERIPAEGFLFKLCTLMSQRKAFTFAALILFLAVSSIGLSKVKIETNHISFLRKDTPISQATDYIEKELGGISSLEITITSTSPEGIKEPAVLRKIAEFQDFLAGLPTVSKTVSPVQFIKEMHQAMNGEDPAFYDLPDSRPLIAQYLLTYSFSGRDNDLEDFMDYSYSIARIRARMKTVGSQELASIIARVRSFADQHFSEELTVRITSHSVMQANMVDTLVWGQIGGLGTGFFIMFLIMLVTHRSALIALIGLIPDVIPLLAGAALMGYSGISLNAGTAMTSCIALGLTVDDTIFFLHHAGEALADKRPLDWTMKTLLRNIAPPVIYATLILASGFGILVFASSYLTIYFGILCAFTIIVALLCDLLVLPLLVYRIPAFRTALAALHTIPKEEESKNE